MRLGLGIIGSSVTSQLLLVQLNRQAEQLENIIDIFHLLNPNLLLSTQALSLPVARELCLPSLPLAAQSTLHHLHTPPSASNHDYPAVTTRTSQLRPNPCG